MRLSQARANRAIAQKFATDKSSGVARFTTIEPMATWRDGAAYAPRERPDGFATPTAAPLPEGEPYRAETPGAVEPPRDLVGAEQPGLDTLGEAAPSTRDPRAAFEVSSASLTAPVRADGTRDPRQPFASYSTATAPEAPPSGTPLDYPPPQVPGPPPQDLTRYPPPQAPRNSPVPQRGVIPYQGPRPPAVDPAQRRLAQVAGGLSLAGFLLGFAAPFLLIAAGVLGLRTRPLSGMAGSLAISSGGALLLWQWLNQTLGDNNLLAGLISLVFAFIFFIAAAKKA